MSEGGTLCAYPRIDKWKQGQRRLTASLACEYCGQMQTTLREAKAKLSEMVERASGGEEILIAVHGKPKARLVPVRPIGDQQNFATWAGVLRERPPRSTVKRADSSGEILKDLREERG